MNNSLKSLQKIPGVGPKIAQDFCDLGIRRPEELKYQDPEDLYERFCHLKGYRVDRCVLYVFRCAVYFASTPDPDPRLLLWWNWKNRSMI
jgi:hypothetical protein